MSLFLTYSPEGSEYLLTPLGYGAVGLLFLLLLGSIYQIGRSRHEPKAGRMDTKRLVFCSAAIALGTVASMIKLGSLPFGGSITLFSMLFVSLTGYLFGLKTGLTAGLAYGILQFITGPYIYAPLQVLLDYPLAFGCLGLSGLLRRQRHGLMTGYLLGVAGRYLCHVLSGYVFFAAYAPEGLDPLIYTLAYNLTYILPEAAVTAAILCVPSVARAIGRIRAQAAD